MSDTVVEVDPPKPSAEMLFADLPLSHEVQLAVQMAGYVKPTPIQAKIIPHMIDGSDILAQSQTGTGKTAAFALPILSKITDRPNSTPQVLVLAPTRELATQVARSFETYGNCLPKLRIAAVYGGADYESQLRALRRGVHVVVGTPGRVIDHIKRGTLKLDGIQSLVLDEADEMLNMGFIEDVEFILQQCPKERQTTLFSATLPPQIREIANRHLDNATSIRIKKKTLTAESIEQRCIFVHEQEKLELLTRLIEMEQTDGVIVFTKTKDSTVHVADHLLQLGLNAAALNGDLPQARRQRTVDQLKSGRLDILVATDVAARGLDVQRISHVFNYDLPHDGESYVHRIGRTGRAGKKGVAYIFLTHRQRNKLQLIERVTKQPIQIIEQPTAREINIARVAKFKNKIVEVADKEDLSIYSNILNSLAAESGKSMEEIAIALAHIAQNGQPLLVKDLPKRKPVRQDRSERSGEFRDGRKPRGGKRFSKRPEPGMRRYWIDVGYADGTKPGNIVGAIANEAGISGKQIGSIDIRDNFSTVDLPDSLSAETLAALGRTWVSSKQLKIRPFREQNGTSSGPSSSFGGGKRKRDGGPSGPSAFKKHKKNKPPHKRKFKNAK